MYGREFQGERRRGGNVVPDYYNLGGKSIGSIVCQGGKKSVYKIGFEKVNPALAKSYNTAKQKKNQETFFIGLFHLSQLFDPVEHPYEVRQEARALVGHGDHGEAGSDDVIVRRHLGVGGAEVGLPGPEIGQSCRDVFVFK